MEFSRIMAVKTLKNLYCLMEVTFNLVQKGWKTKIQKEKLKLAYSVALGMTFLATENKHQLLEDLPQANFSQKDKVNN